MSKKILFLSVALIIGVSFFVGVGVDAVTKLGDGTYELNEGDKIQLNNGLTVVPVYFMSGSGSYEFSNVKFDVYLGENKVTTTDFTRVGWTMKTFNLDYSNVNYVFRAYVLTMGTSGGVWFSTITLESGSVSITVLSPNGGESLISGDTVQIRWSSNNLPASSLVNISLLDDQTRYGSKIFPSISNTGSTSWLVSPLSSITDVWGRSLLPSGNYVVHIECADHMCQVDDSNSYFTIATTTSSCTDSDGGKNPNIAGLTDGRINGIGSYFNDISVASNGGQCSGESCTSVAEGYCTADGQVSNILTPCSTGYSKNGACATKPATQPSIMVTNPNGGETYSMDSTIIATVVSNYTIQYLSVSLYSSVNGNVYQLQNTSPIQTGSSNTAISLRELKNVGYNIVPGQYKITACDERTDNPSISGKPLCDSSNSYFTIISSTLENRPPAINGVSAPTTLNVNQTGTWTVKASDPENGQLSYSVNWGDANEKQLDSASALNGFIQTSTFTHSYFQAGIYTSIFTVKDSAGLTAQTSATVRVEDNSTPVNSCSVAPLAAMDSSLSPKLFNIDFGKWLPGASDKTGSAIVGKSGDYWNVLGVPWCDDHNKNNLKNADQSSSSIIVEMKNLGGGWGDGGKLLGLYDPMLKDFSYPANNKGGNAYVVMSNVPAGSYDLYLYNKTSNDSQNGDYAATVGGRSYGRKLMTTDVGSYKANSWQENNQFVIFKVAVNSGESIKILIQPSVGGFHDAQIAGLQLAPAGTPPAVAYSQYSSDIVPVKPLLVTVSEQVKCVFKFKGFASEQKCYTATDDSSSYRNYGCGGTGSCAVDMKGMNGDKITRKSSCAGYGYSVMDGSNENVTFYCADSAVVEEKKIDEQILDINEKSKLISNNNNFDFILAELNQLRSIIKEQQTEIKYLKSLVKNVQDLSEKAQAAINNFITYGVDKNTEKLGAGERAAVMNSYKAAFDKLPETEAELADAIKIANGRWPSMTNDAAEKKAKEQFQKIYKKIADMNNANDNAAVTVMAYGLRQKAENRNLNSEKQGIQIFKGIYGRTPNSTEDWNIMQAITYSGSGRGVDSDGDLLTDDREKELGTDLNNKDTDGDGYLDGAEVANGFDPLKK